MKLRLSLPSRPMQQSASILYALVALAAMVFGAFFLIGYDMPYDENPTFNEPRLTGLLLGFVLLLLAGAVVAAIVSVAITARRRAGEGQTVNGIPARRIGLCTAGLLAGSLLLTFLLGSPAPIAVNGKSYADGFWLRMADMFIFTSIILLLAAAIIVVCSNVRNTWFRR